MPMSGPRRVLVVEDEYLLADDLTKILDLDGAVVVGPVATEADALVLLEGVTVDCAILDINLRGRMVYPLARTLRDRQVPFVFVSGYETPAPDAGFDDVELIQKPFTSGTVIQGLDRLFPQGAGGDASGA